MKKFPCNDECQKASDGLGFFANISPLISTTGINRGLDHVKCVKVLVRRSSPVRKLASTEFGAFLQDALRDRLVCGLRNTAAQKNLLSEENLTLEKAIRVAQSLEAADKNAKPTIRHQQFTEQVTTVSLSLQGSLVLKPKRAIAVAVQTT